MVKLKWAFGLLLMMLCFIMSSEMYQKYIENFTNELYYLDIDHDHLSSETIDAIKKIADDNHSLVFAFGRRTMAASYGECKFYADENTAEYISNHFDIREGLYDSFFSGSTEIGYYGFQEIAYNSNIERLYFTATSNDMDRIYEVINRIVPTSYVHKEGVFNYQWIMLGVWVITVLFLLFLTWCGIQFDKKKQFIRISLGASRLSVALKAIVWDIAVFTAEFLLSFFILKRLIYCEYGLTKVCALFAGFLVLASLMNLTYIKYDYKEILLSANINSSLLSNCYLMKAITLILAIVCISINIPLMLDSCSRITFYNSISGLQGYEFININVKSADDSDSDMLYEQFDREIFFQGLVSGNVKYAASVMGIDDDKNILMLNDERFILNESLRERIDKSNDFTVFIPEGVAVTEDNCISSISDFLGIDEQDINASIVHYKEHCDVMYLNPYAEAEGKEQLRAQSNTAFIYCHASAERLKTITNADDVSPYSYSAILYEKGWIDSFRQSELQNTCDIYTHNAVKSLTKDKAAAQRILIMNTVVSGFMLLLEFLLIVSIIKLEYTIHAKPLAIKKILGYGLIVRNKELLLLNAYAASIGIVTNIILALMYKITQWYFSIVAGLLLMLIEFGIIIYMGMKTERINVSKILKGGCL